VSGSGYGLIHATCGVRRWLRPYARQNTNYRIRKGGVEKAKWLQRIFNGTGRRNRDRIFDKCVILEQGNYEKGIIRGRKRLLTVTAADNRLILATYMKR
jgi:hypothetical protein